MKRMDVWRLALLSLLPALAFGGCDCTASGEGCQPIKCNLDFSEHCKIAADCTPPPGLCQVAACVAQRCVDQQAADGVAPPDMQTAGDCVVASCQGGQLVNLPASDPPTITDPCRAGSCQDGSTLFINADDGTSCALSDGGSAACVGGACLRLPDDVPGTGGGGTGGGDAGTGDGGTDDAGTDGGSSDGGSSDGGPVGDPPGCVHCSEILYGASTAKLCPSAKPLYAALTSCICGPTCGGACGPNLCQHHPADTSCDDCTASVTSGCGAELIACNQDL